ncbi:class I SAM-dependent methyltransferase [Benzoatithermus flavus]|uniref:Methyltransferase domain-containing protein n=1 Tax=Benzoatithermus flavus TaxID=3108223 RepID=A0ABU8XP23_9PROT
MTLQTDVAAHYGRDELLARLDAALRQLGKDPTRLTIDDLAPIDEFHARGREATVEIAAALPAGITGEVLDIGSGIGGPARYLAARYGLEVAGIDLTPQCVATARELTRRCGLEDRVRFLEADATRMPFASGSFAAAVTVHAAMNIADKEALYGETARVLVPGAAFVIYDILQGPGGEVAYPTPWSMDGRTSFLVDPPALCRLLADAGFEVLEIRDRTAESIEWFEAMAARAAAAGGPPPVGLHLLFGPVFAEMRDNLLRNLREARIAPTLIRAVRR